MEVKLFNRKIGQSYTDIVARIGSDGRLELDCGYGGPEVKQMTGDYDEELHYYVNLQDKDLLLLELLREVFGGDDTACSRFKTWLEAHGIDYEFAYFR